MTSCKKDISATDLSGRTSQCRWQFYYFIFHIPSRLPAGLTDAVGCTGPPDHWSPGQLTGASRSSQEQLPSGFDRRLYVASAVKGEKPRSAIKFHIQCQGPGCPAITADRIQRIQSYLARHASCCSGGWKPLLHTEGESAEQHRARLQKVFDFSLHNCQQPAVLLDYAGDKAQIPACQPPAVKERKRQLQLSAADSTKRRCLGARPTAKLCSSQIPAQGPQPQALLGAGQLAAKASGSEAQQPAQQEASAGDELWPADCSKLNSHSVLC